MTRLGFDHEFTVLRGIFNHYTSRFNRNYRLPFLRDHNKMLKVKEGVTVRKDLTVDEFKRFLAALQETVGNTRWEVVYYIALMQYAIYGRIAHRYDQALKLAGLPFRGTHLIRHASLSEHYDTSKNILATAKVAGHSDLRATERYAKARDETVAETQRQMDKKLRDLLPNSG